MEIFHRKCFFVVVVNLKSFFEIEVNILSLVTEISKNNCFSIHTRCDLNNTRSQYLQKKASHNASLRTGHFVLFGSFIIHSLGSEKCSITPRQRANQFS